jgi:hypothetical protein
MSHTGFDKLSLTTFLTNMFCKIKKTFSKREGFLTLCPEQESNLHILANGRF